MISEIMFSLGFILSLLCWANNNFLQKKVKVFLANNFILQYQCRSFLFLKDKIQVKMVLKVFQQLFSYETSAQNEMHWIPIWIVNHERRAKFLNQVCTQHTNVAAMPLCVCVSILAHLTLLPWLLDCLITSQDPKPLCSVYEQQELHEIIQVTLSSGLALILIPKQGLPM